MKKFLSLALSVLMLLSLLAGCGGGSSTDDGAQQDGGSETAETGGKLVVYSALNEDNTIAMAEQFEKDTGIVLQKIRKAERNAASTKHLFHKGQVLYSKLRPYLNKVVLADEDGYCTPEILPLEFERNILPKYARYYLMSPAFLGYANKCSYGVKMGSIPKFV